MATKLFFHNAASDYGTGSNDARLNATTGGWVAKALNTTQGSSVISVVTTSVAGPTNGLEVDVEAAPYVWYSPPLDADITISGSVTWNLRAAESSNSANASVNGRLEKIDGATAAITLIDATARTTELGTSEAAANFSETPGAGVACKRGDRLRVRVYFDDSTANMGTGFNLTFWFDGATGATGDSWVQLTENLTFASEPAGTQIFPTDTASAVSTASVDREAWTSRGGGVQTDITNTSAGWAAPRQITDTAGGTVVDWFTRPLASFTLGGAVRCNLRGVSSSTLANAGHQVEIARVAGDGTGATVWAVGVCPVEILASGETVSSFLISGDDLAVSDGERLRIRWSIDDYGQVLMPTGHTVTTYYAGTSGGASGDTYLTFTQTLTEFSAGTTVTPTTAAVVITKHIPTVTASDHQLVTPTTKALTATAFAPTVSTPELATPSTVSLVLALFPPTVSFTDNQLLTPTTAALATVTFAPVITAPEPQTVTPATATLTLTANAPTVTASDHQTVTPTTAALTATKYAPIVGTQYYAAVIATGPLAWWRLGEPSGTVSDDEIGSANADYVNTPTLGVASLLSGDTNTSVTFSRASLDHTSANTNMPAGSSAGFSAKGWVRFATVTAATRYPIVRWFGGTGAPDTQIYYNVAVGAWRYLYQDATGFRNTHSDAWAPSTATTYFIVVTHDYSAESVKFYVNGALLSTEDVSVNGVPVVHAAGSSASVGRAASDYWDGTIDEPALYNGVLTPTQVLALYNAGSGAAGPQLVTPMTLALTLSAFAPTVTAPDHQLVTPTTKALVLATFAPTVTAPDHQVVTPSNAAVTLATFAPTVSAADHQTATPTTATLTTASFVPAVSVSDHQAVIPTTKALTLTAFAPTATTPILATPTTASLVTTSNAPTVSTPELVTPTTKALSLSTFAPTITNPQTYVPDTAIVVLTKYAPIVDVTAASTIVVPNATLTITENAPTVTANQHVTVVPDTATLVTSPQVPTVAASDQQSVTPTTKALSLSVFAPTVTTSDQQAVIPTTKALTLATFAPTVSTTAHVAVIPSTKVLQLNAFAPQARVANYAIPTTAGLTLSAFAPFVESTQNAYVEIVPNALTITEYPPTLAITGHADIVPLTAELHLALFPPSAEQHSITPLPVNIYGFAIVAMGDSAGVEGQNGGATVRSEGGSTAVSSSGPSARVTIR